MSTAGSSALGSKGHTATGQSDMRGQKVTQASASALSRPCCLGTPWDIPSTFKGV